MAELLENWAEVLTDFQQTALYLAVGIVPASGILYYASRPGEDGAQPRITQWIDSFQLDALKKWEERTQIHTKLIEQAAHDRHLFFYADTKPHIELKSPEYVFPAGW